MKILLVRSGRKPEAKEIDGSLKTMQHLVGGTIQALYPFEAEVALVCNDEGRLLALPLNRALRDENGSVYDIICGDFFLCGTSGENFASLQDDQITRYMKRFSVPEILNISGNITVLPSI